MSNGQSFIEYLRQLKEEKRQIICDWKSIRKKHPNQFTNLLISHRKQYSTIMKQGQFCSINDNHSFLLNTINNNILDIYDCRPQEDTFIFNEDMNFNDKQLLTNKQNLMACKLMLKYT